MKKEKKTLKQPNKQNTTPNKKTSKKVQEQKIPPKKYNTYNIVLDFVTNVVEHKTLLEIEKMDGIIDTNLNLIFIDCPKIFKQYNKNLDSWESNSNYCNILKLIGEVIAHIIHLDFRLFKLSYFQKYILNQTNNVTELEYLNKIIFYIKQGLGEYYQNFYQREYPEVDSQLFIFINWMSNFESGIRYLLEGKQSYFAFEWEIIENHVRYKLSKPEVRQYFQFLRKNIRDLVPGAYKTELLSNINELEVELGLLRNYEYNEVTTLDVGYMKEGQYYWDQPLTQLAWVIYELRKELSLLTKSPYRIVNYLEGTKKIEIKGSWGSIKTYYENIKRDKGSYRDAEVVDNAKPIILKLLTE